MGAFGKHSEGELWAQKSYLFASPTVAVPVNMQVNDQVVRVTHAVDGMGDPELGVIYLPTVQDAAGRLYYFCNADPADIDGVSMITGGNLIDQSALLLGSGGCADILLYSTGFEWVIITTGSNDLSISWILPLRTKTSLFISGIVSCQHRPAFTFRFRCE